MEGICDLVEEYTIFLEEKDSVRKEIEQRMTEFDSLEHKVAYLRDVQRMTLSEIAADLSYRLYLD